MSGTLGTEPTTALKHKRDDEFFEEPQLTQTQTTLHTAPSRLSRQ
jgi:hypothetical protein